MNIEVFKKILPAEMEKDEEYLTKKKVENLEDAAYHEGFCDGFNQWQKKILMSSWKSERGGEDVLCKIPWDREHI